MTEEATPILDAEPVESEATLEVEAGEIDFEQYADDQVDEDADIESESEEGADSQPDDDTPEDESEGEEQSPEIAQKIKDLESGYNRKFEDLASERKTVTAERQQLAEQAKSLQDQLAFVQMVLQSQLGEAPSQELMRTDFNAYMRQKAEYDAKLQNIHEFNAEFEQMRTAESERWKQETLQAEQDKLLQMIPEWQDETVRANESQALGEYLTASYFTEEEVANTYDARLFALANKARKWDELQANHKTTKQKAKTPVAKVEKAKSGGSVSASTSKHTAAMQRLEKDDSPENWYSVVEGII